MCIEIIAVCFLLFVFDCHFGIPHVCLHWGNKTYFTQSVNFIWHCFQQQYTLTLKVFSLPVVSLQRSNSMWFSQGCFNTLLETYPVSEVPISKNQRKLWKGINDKTSEWDLLASDATSKIFVVQMKELISLRLYYHRSLCRVVLPCTTISRRVFLRFEADKFNNPFRGQTYR